MSRLLMVAGEASGDLHAARLLESLPPLCGSVEAFGLGGDELGRAGLESVAHSREVAVVGITEVIKVLPRARQVFHLLLAEVDRRRPEVAVLVDFPDFNLRLAKALKRRGVPVIYYVSPQIWAWRKGRVKTIARWIDEMLVLFPFEATLYADHGVQCFHVGHPLIDEVPELDSVWDQPAAAGGGYRLALLPGSRHSEVDVLAPVMLRVAERLAAVYPGLTVRLIMAQTVDRERLDRLVAEAGLDLKIEIVSAGRFEAVADSHLALCASGTATLEVGLLGTPMVVIYRLQRWSYWLGRWLVRIPAFSLVNLVLGTGVVPELIQHETEPDRIVSEARRLLDDEAARGELRTELARLRPTLGSRGASQRAARRVARFLCPERAGSWPSAGLETGA